MCFIGNKITYNLHMKFMKQQYVGNINYKLESFKYAANCWMGQIMENLLVCWRFWILLVV